MLCSLSLAPFLIPFLSVFFSFSPRSLPLARLLFSSFYSSLFFSPISSLYPILPLHLSSPYFSHCFLFSHPLHSFFIPFPYSPLITFSLFQLSPFLAPSSSFPHFLPYLFPTLFLLSSFPIFLVLVFTNLKPSHSLYLPLLFFLSLPSFYFPLPLSSLRAAEMEYLWSAMGVVMVGCYDNGISRISFSLISSRIPHLLKVTRGDER